MSALVSSKFILFLCSALLAFPSLASSVRIKELARVEGVQENALIGYGLVVGLSGTGDTERNKATLQSLRNTLLNFSVQVPLDQIRSRNVAAVMVTSQLPGYAQAGDKLEVNVSSIGDARSLQGGTLLLTPLKAVDNNIYALAQGALSVGGYRVDYNGNRAQKNHPTVGVIPNGATVERDLDYEFSPAHQGLTLILKQPDFTTAARIIQALQQHFPGGDIHSNHPGKVFIKPAANESVISLMAKIENIKVVPDNFARVVVNERNGTIVAGAKVRIDDVVISHGALKLKIQTRFSPSQPTGLIGNAAEGVSSLVVANSQLDIEEEGKGNVAAIQGSNIGELVDALKALNLTTRELISVLQAIKQAGALHAELVIQ